jgi:dCTP deaminase
MILKSDRIAKLLDPTTADADPLVITPAPGLEELRDSGSASVDLRLGTWFLKFRQSRSGALMVSGNRGAEQPDEHQTTEVCYVPLGGTFILHPQTFVLGVTLEWVRLPKNLAGYVVGRSSWGRRGLIIATAAGVHPGFTGCLTLELTNVGEMPIEINPGLEICQLFLEEVATDGGSADHSSFVGFRRPTLGRVAADPIAEKLKSARLRATAGHTASTPDAGADRGTK